MPQPTPTSLYSVVVQQHCDRALLFYGSMDEDAPRPVFDKLVVSERFVLLQACICGRDLRQMYFGKDAS